MRAFGALLILASGVLAAACGPSGGTPRPEPATPVVLTVFEGQSTSDPGIEDMINDLVAQTVPGVELRWETVGWGDQFEQQARAKFAAGEVPDLIIGKAQDVAAFQPSGNLAPLPGSLTAMVRPGALGSVTIGGQVYGLPYNTFYQGILYNKNIFRRLGLEIPRTPDQLRTVVQAIEAHDGVAFASHFVETWYAGNVFMQLALGEILGRDPTWGQRFRAGQTSFATSPDVAWCFDQMRYLYRHTWPDASVIDQAEADQRFSKGRAAMYPTGSWTLQNIDTAALHPEFGIFPYPNSMGTARLIFEPNITFMKSSRSDHPDAVDRVLLSIAGSSDLASRLTEFTKTSSLLTVPVAAEPLLIQADIDRYREKGQLVDATAGNSQLIWTFQSQVASRLGDWLQGKTRLDEVSRWADANRSLSAP